MTDPMLFVWLGLTVVFIIIEAAGPNLTTVWFAGGSAAALIAQLLGAPIWLQITVFVVVSAVLLILTRPFAKKFVNSRKQPTNADAVIGTECIVTEDIDNIAATGAVNAGGKAWTARSAEGGPIPRGTLVTVREISGVKLMVAPVKKEEE